MEQLQQRNIRNIRNIKKGTFHLAEGTDWNIKNNVLEHLTKNFEQIGTGKGAVLQRRISVEQLQQRGTL